MEEIVFIQSRKGNEITIINKHAMYIVGCIHEENNHFTIDGVDKCFCHLGNAIDRLIRNASNID